MLIGEHGGGHEYSHLLGVGGSLESGSHCYLGLAEANVATHKSVHGARFLHVGLHVICGLQLVGRVLIKETGFQFLLQI